MDAKISTPPRLAWLLVGAPFALVALGLVLHYGVEVPEWDEWDTPGLFFEHWLSGGVTWRDWFAQHNESRKAVARLLFLIQALTVGWRVKWFMVFSLLVVGATFALLRRFAPASTERGAWVFPAVAAALLFSPAQAENQLWGIQFIVVLPALCLVLGLRVQAANFPPGATAAACGALAWIATFSFANGQLLWLLLWPGWDWLHGERRDRRTGRSIIAYTFAGVVTLVCYHVGLVHPPAHPFILDALRQPLLLMHYFCVWAGGPFAQGFAPMETLAAALGLPLAVAAAATMATALRRWRTLKMEERAWLTLLAYGLLSGALTTLGRAGFGVPFAASSRYATFELWLPLGLLGRAWIRGGPAALGLGGGLAALSFAGWCGGIAEMGRSEPVRRQNLAVVRTLALAPGQLGLEKLHPRPDLVLARAAIIRSAGWWSGGDVSEWLPAALDRAESGGGWFSSVPGPGLDGWGWVPPQSRPPDFLVVTRQDAAGERRAIAAFAPVVDRPDVAAAHGPAMLRSGFRGGVSEAGPVEVFAVDATNRVAYRLRQHGATE